MAKISFYYESGEMQANIRVKPKKERTEALELYTQLTSAVHVGAAFTAQYRSNEFIGFNPSYPILTISFSGKDYPLYLDDFITTFSDLKAARRKLARKLELMP